MSTKKALLVGINYRGTGSELNGCINDVNAVKQYLLKSGYGEQDITMLTDDTEIKPTHRNISTALHALIMSGAEQLYFHYSGHGSWQKDTSGDEADGRDESIVPIDYAATGMLTDDQLRGLLSFMPVRSKLTAVLDSCHSGTALDLAYSLKAGYKIANVRRGRRMVKTRVPTLTMQKDQHYKPTPGPVTMISGCLDIQTSADAYEEGKYQGALTYCLLKALEVKSDYTWVELITTIRALLKQHGYQQIANLTSGQSLDLSSTVVFC